MVYKDGEVKKHPFDLAAPAPASFSTRKNAPALLPPHGCTYLVRSACMALTADKSKRMKSCRCSQKAAAPSTAPSSTYSFSCFLPHMLSVLCVAIVVPLVETPGGGVGTARSGAVVVLLSWRGDIGKVARYGNPPSSLHQSTSRCGFVQARAPRGREVDGCLCGGHSQQRSPHKQAVHVNSHALGIVRHTPWPWMLESTCLPTKIAR